MPEALTESFCERCGTRYEFAAPTQLNTMRKTRGLISGLKNYIMSQDALGDAVGDAMRSEEEALASQQLEAFHESFNFCINCRQYTCLNCWNDDAGRCRTCVPIAGTDDLLERFEASFHAQHPEIAAAAAQAEMDQADLNRRLGLESWPSEDLSHAPANGARARLAGGRAATVRAGADGGRSVEPEPEPSDVAEAAMAAAAIDAASADDYPPLRVVAWEEDAAIALEPEPIVAAEVEPEPRSPSRVAAEPSRARGRRRGRARAGAEPDRSPPSDAEPEPVVADDGRSRARAASRAEPRSPPEPIRPISETIVPDAAAAAAAGAGRRPRGRRGRRRVDCRPQGAARPAGHRRSGSRERWPDRSNVLPYRSSGASVSAREMAMRTASGLPAPGAFWEASAREVAGAMSHVGVQSCGECGLSLSASARFCRRCGTRRPVRPSRRVQGLGALLLPGVLGRRRAAARRLPVRVRRTLGFVSLPVDGLAGVDAEVDVEDEPAERESVL